MFSITNLSSTPPRITRSMSNLKNPNQSRRIELIPTTPKKPNARFMVPLDDEDFELTRITRSMSKLKTPEQKRRIELSPPPAPKKLNVRFQMPLDEVIMKKNEEIIVFHTNEIHNRFKVRYNKESKLISVFDLGRGLGSKENTINTTWSRIKKNHPNIVSECKYSKFSGSRQKSWGCDYLTAIKLILIWPGNQAQSMRLKMSRCISEHFISRNLTTHQKVIELNTIFKTLPTSNEINEKEKKILIQLHKKMGGEKEVKCKNGIIDLITNDEIIEIKIFNNWKHAIGQILVYACDYPTHQKKLILFGEENKYKFEKIKSICELFNIQVEFV